MEECKERCERSCELCRELHASIKALPDCERTHDLWCVHVIGPDDLIAVKSREEAETAAKELEEDFLRLRAKMNDPYSEGDPLVKFTVTRWPYSPESHAEALRNCPDWRKAV